MQLDESQQEPMRRLRELAEKTNGAMEVPDIVEAVVGVDSDEEIVGLVKAALEASDSPMSLEEIASGIAKLVLWRGENC